MCLCWSVCGGGGESGVTEPVLSVRGMGRSFGSVVALQDVSFDIQSGETHAIMGENGAGKSTLMKILAGVQSPSRGELLLRGERVSFTGTRDAESAGISMIHQELNLVEQLSVSANIFLGRELTNGWGVLRQGEMDRRAAVLLEQLETPIDPRALVGSLRVGDQQLVEIARGHQSPLPVTMRQDGSPLEPRQPQGSPWTGSSCRQSQRPRLTSVFR